MSNLQSEREQAALLGKQGEEIAAQHLRAKGYIIIKRNWRDSRYGEIDIVAESKEEILFVEVRTRRHGALASGAETVDSHKLLRVKNAAQMFMNRFNSDLPFRVDLIEITYYNKPSENPTGKRWVLRHIKNI